MDDFYPVFSPSIRSLPFSTRSPVSPPSPQFTRNTGSRSNGARKNNFGAVYLVEKHETRHSRRELGSPFPKDDDDISLDLCDANL